MKVLGIFFRIALFASLFSYTPAQHDHHGAAPPAETKSEKTYLVDEFGPLGHCDFTARFDGLFQELSEKPSAQGYIIFYRSADALPGRYDDSPHSRLFQQHLAFRNFDSSRITIADGGYRKGPSVQIWIVPPGGEVPEPSMTVAAPTIPVNKTFLFDSSPVLLDDSGELLREFELPSVTAERKASEEAAEAESREEERSQRAAALASGEDLEPEEEPAESEDPSDESEVAEEDPPTAEEIEAARFDWISPKFGSLLADRKNSTGVIILYADEETYDINRLRNFIEEGRKRLADAAGISIGRISIQFGGYRHTVTTEFWVVSKKGGRPVATPDERPAPEEVDTGTTDN